MGRTNNFDGLRLLAAMAVLLSHMAVLSGREDLRSLKGQTWGTLGVFVFFAISGYLVLASWRSDPNMGRFLERRFLRIAPGLGVAMLSAFLVVKALGLTGFPNNRFHWINGSLWTIEYEAYCYLILTGLAAALCWPVVASACLLLGAVVMGLESYLITFGAFFVAGMAMFEYPLLRRWWWAVAGLGLAAMPYDTKILALLIAPIVVVVGTKSWPILRSAGRYGDLSYGVYIYAYPVQQIVVASMGPRTPYWALLAVTLPIVLLCAWLSWRYIESPWLARKPKKPSQSPVAAACAAIRVDDSTDPKPAHSPM
jgi:peptidoglycan/LPS O-acetylase OafA/YrhL